MMTRYMLPAIASRRAGRRCAEIARVLQSNRDAVRRSGFGTQGADRGPCAHSGVIALMRFQKGCGGQSCRGTLYGWMYATILLKELAPVSRFR